MGRLTINFFGSLLFCVLLFGCTQSVILLSPEDLYSLGNYYIEEEKYSDAGDQFQRIRDVYPTSRFATMSQFMLALTEYEKGNYEEAAVEFELFLEFHPAHKLAPRAQYYVAMSKFNSYPSPERDITLAVEARKELEEFLRVYPDHPDVETVRKYRIEVIDHLQTHEIEVARVYYRRGNYKAAHLRLDPVLDSEASPAVIQEAMYLSARTYEKQEDTENARRYYLLAIDNGTDAEFTEKSRERLNRL